MSESQEPISNEERRREAELDALRLQITEDDPGYFDRLADRIIAEFEAEGGGIRMEEFLGLPPAEEMSDLQDKLDRGEITPQEYHDQRDKEMEENERLHPGIHDRLYEYLMAKYPGPGVDADEFFR